MFIYNGILIVLIFIIPWRDKVRLSAVHVHSRVVAHVYKNRFSSQVAKTEPGGIWRKMTADARTPKMPCFQGFPHPFASKPLWKSESESLLRFCRVLTDFRKSLLEFLIEPSDFSPQNHAFGSAWKAPVMPNCTQSRVGKCRGEIKTAVIGKNISKAEFKWLILPIMWYAWGVIEINVIHQFSTLCWKTSFSKLLSTKKSYGILYLSSRASALYWI